MISAINNQQLPAFQAKLKTSWTKMPEADKIAKKFEEATQHYKDDIFEIVADKVEKGDTGKTFKCASFLTNGTEVGFMNTFGDFKNFCREHTPEQVAKSLAKVFKVGKLTEKTNAQASAIHKNLRSANLTLFRAENGAQTRANQVLADNAHKRIGALKGDLADLQDKRIATKENILKNDPIEFSEAIEKTYI